MKKHETYPELLLSDVHGIYIPKKFAEMYKRHRDNKDGFKVSGLDQEDLDILQDPDHDHYWDTWDWALRNVKIKNKHGTEFTLYQEGDLWVGSKSQFNRFFKEQ